MIAVSCFSNRIKFMLDMSYSSYQNIKIALGLPCAARISKPRSRNPLSIFWIWGWKRLWQSPPSHLNRTSTNLDSDRKPQQNLNSEGKPQQNLNKTRKPQQTSTEPQQNTQTSTEPQQNTQTSTDLNRTSTNLNRPQQIPTNLNRPQQNNSVEVC